MCGGEDRSGCLDWRNGNFKIRAFAGCAREVDIPPVLLRDFLDDQKAHAALFADRLAAGLVEMLVFGAFVDTVLRLLDPGPTP